jgi:hypothetical protein
VDCKIGDVVRFHDSSVSTTGKVIAKRENGFVVIKRDDGVGWQDDRFGGACWGVLEEGIDQVLSGSIVSLSRNARRHNILSKLSIE